MIRKIFLSVLIFIMSTFSFAGGSARISFLELFPMHGPMFLKQSPMNYGGVLAIYSYPSTDSEIITTVTAADVFFSFDKRVLSGIAANKWIEVGFFDKGSVKVGWALANSIVAIERFDLIEGEDFSLLYPYFLDALEQDDGGLYVSYGLGLEHISGCDERDEPEILTQRELFGMGFHVYDSLKEALINDFSWYYQDDKFDTELHYDAATDWFGQTSEYDFVSRENDFFGKDAYKIEIGAEGCGVDYYYYRQDGKVVVISKPFDWTPPFNPATGEPIEGNWDMPSENQIMYFLLSNLKIKP